MMNKRILIPIIAVLVAGVMIAGSSCVGEAIRLRDELEDAQSQIATLEQNVSSLEGEVSSLQASLSDSGASVSSLEAELESAQNALTAQQDANSALAEEMKTVKDPEHFESLAELTDWLYQDDTDEIYGYEDPLIVAYILQVRALRDGYLLPVDIDVVDGNNYISNCVVIGDSIYWVDAASDDIDWANYVEPIPSHPLPLE